MNIFSFYQAVRVFGWLLWYDVRFLAKDFWDNLLDSLVWPTAIIAINGYIMPAMGLSAQYGMFMVASQLVIMGAYTAWVGSATIAADLAGEQAISYELTLPLPYWMVWLEKGLYLALKASIFNITSLGIGKLILGSAFSLEHFSLGKFLVIYILSSLFFGMFALWSTVITKSVEAHSRLDVRLVGPLFYVSGFSASWAIMYQASAWLGILTLCTPWVYAYEGMRVAVLGQSGYLPFWVCVGMLILFLIFFTALALRLFKKRLDCV